MDFRDVLRDINGVLITWNNMFFRGGKQAGHFGYMSTMDTNQEF